MADAAELLARREKLKRRVRGEVYTNGQRIKADAAPAGSIPDLDDVMRPKMQESEKKNEEELNKKVAAARSS